MKPSNFIIPGEKEKMARITVEKCLDFNRFELVLLAAQRAHDISRGSPLTVDRDNDKNSVVALREIEKETVSVIQLREGIIRTFMQHVDQEDEDHPELEALTEESDWLRGTTDAGNIKEEIAEDALTVTDEIDEPIDVADAAIVDEN